MSKNQRPSPKMPPWVKIFVVILVVLILLVMVMHVMGFRVDHGTGGMLVGGIAYLNEHNGTPL